MYRQANSNGLNVKQKQNELSGVTTKTKGTLQQFDLLKKNASQNTAKPKRVSVQSFPCSSNQLVWKPAQFEQRNNKNLFYQDFFSISTTQKDLHSSQPTSIQLSPGHTEGDALPCPRHFFFFFSISQNGLRHRMRQCKRVWCGHIN